jgi:hypothetical protein
MLATWSGLPAPVGQPLPRDGVGAGAAALRITAVGTDVAFVEPSAFVARTLKRSVFPASADVSVYFVAFAPLMLAQLPPFLSQRIQK